MDLEDRFRAAVQSYWTARRAQKEKQVEKGVIDAGTRGAVTGGTQMGALEVLVSDLLEEPGLVRLVETIILIFSSRPHYNTMIRGLRHSYELATE